MKLRYWLLAAIAITVFLALSQIAFSYPENIRFGYQGCVSCHVSPTGGGALTAYGRSTSEEMATWAKEGDGQFFGGLVPTPTWLALGGDTRYININVPDLKLHRKFLMQADAEIAVHPLSYLWLDASYGTYGELGLPESRRNYLLWVPSKFWSIRLGKFMPAYGIMQPDHTNVVRAVAWKEGSETYNAEFYLHGDEGEITLTGIVGAAEDEAEVRLRDQEGYQLAAARSGGTVRAAAYLGDRGQLGVSGAYMRQEDYNWALTGVFGLWGITRDLYLLGEADRRTQSDDSEPISVGWGEVGYEFVRGIHIKAAAEVQDEQQKYSAALQWFPTPAYEILARAKHSDGLWTYTLLLHGHL